MVWLNREALSVASRKAGVEVGEDLLIVNAEGFGYALPYLVTRKLSDCSICKLGKFWQIKSLVQDCFQISQDYCHETYVLECLCPPMLVLKKYEVWGSLL